MCSRYGLGMVRDAATECSVENERIGATLRTIREIQGFKVGEFACELGISYAYLSNIEAGRKRLTPQLLAKAARALNVRQVAIVRPGYFDSEAA